MRFSPAFLDEIRARIPVSDVVRQKVKLQKQGREWRGLSPFNAEKTPSFYVNDQKGFFHDFSSGKHGDGFAFLMESEGLSFPEAVERLAGLAGLPMPVESSEQREQDEKRASLGEVLEWAAAYFEKELRGPEGREARDYLARRAIGDTARAQFRLGYAPAARHGLRDYLAAKGASVEAMIETGLLIHGEDIAVPYDRFRNRIMFPICDRSGRVIAFGGRAMEKDAQAKYLNSPETPLFHKGATLYNLHNARKAAHEAGTVIAVEGYIDVISMTAAGFPHTVAPLGTALTADQCELLWRMAEEPILCFDGDKAGQKAAYRAIETALPLIGPGRTLKFVLLPGGQDPDELFRASGAGAVAQAIDGALPFVDVLWKRETEGQALDTPERRAALERRLSAVAAQIADESLRRHYSQEFSQRLFELFGQQGDSRGRVRAYSARGRGAAARFSREKGGPAPRGPVQIGASLASSPLFRGVKSAVSPREALILIIFINHPTLLASHIEDIAGLELASGEAEALRNILVRCAQAGLTTGQEVNDAIEQAGLSPLRDRLSAMGAHSSLWSVQPDAATVDAAESLRQAFVLHRRARALNRELRMIEARLAENPSEQDSARLRDIQTQLSALEGTEAALEGFGSMSGRGSRDL
jgi:DNA primase